jgi:hypothetical protein
MSASGLWPTILNGGRYSKWDRPRTKSVSRILSAARESDKALATMPFRSVMSSVTLPSTAVAQDVAVVDGTGNVIAVGSDGGANGTVTLIRAGHNKSAITLPGGTLVLYCVDSNGLTVVAGYDDGGASTSLKIIQSADGGETWTQRNLATAAATNVVGMRWFSPANLFVAAVNGSPGVIETSPDGITWTARTNPGTTVGWTLNRYGGCAASPTEMILVPVSGNQFLRSTNATTWTAEAVPAGTYVGAAYTPRYGWVAFTDSTAIESTDGTSWALSTTVTVPSDCTAVTSVMSQGNVLALWHETSLSSHSVMSYSTDGGATWAKGLLATVSALPAFGGVTSGGRALTISDDAERKILISQRGF